MRRLLSISAFALAACALLATPAWAEPLDNLEVIGGIANVSAYSALYKPLKESDPSLEVQYNHVLTGRWSLTGRYLYAVSGSFAGYSGGVMFSSRPAHVEGGDITNDGQREVRVAPKWLFRGAVLVGAWSLLGTFDLASPKIGQKPRAPVSADLYGFEMSGEMLHFLAENHALVAQVEDISALAANFNVNALTVLFGYSFFY